MYYAHKSFTIFKVKHMTNFEQLKKITFLFVHMFIEVLRYSKGYHCIVIKTVIKIKTQVSSIDMFMM